MGHLLHGTKIVPGYKPCGMLSLLLKFISYEFRGQDLFWVRNVKFQQCAHCAVDHDPSYFGHCDAYIAPQYTSTVTAKYSPTGHRGETSIRADSTERRPVAL